VSPFFRIYVLFIDIITWVMMIVYEYCKFSCYLSGRCRGDVNMRILAHRGYWNSSIGKNSPEALKTALAKGYGFESDVRDYMGKLVISHNMAGASSQEVEAD